MHYESLGSFQTTFVCVWGLWFLAVVAVFLHKWHFVAFLLGGGGFQYYVLLLTVCFWSQLFQLQIFQVIVFGWKQATDARLHSMLYFVIL